MNEAYEFKDSDFLPLEKNTLDADAVVRKKTTYIKDVWRSFRKNKAAVISLAAMGVMIVFVIFGPMMTGFDYYSNNYSAVNNSPTQYTFSVRILWEGIFGKEYWWEAGFLC
jgi:hypothetical protein